MLKSTTYSGLEQGPRFLIIGAVHGNEKCGTVAIERIVKEIEAGTLHILRGQVTFVPIANPRAYDQDKRFTERNLNRYLVPMKEPNSYEARIGNVLCPMLEECDVHLAIHSYTVGGAPFLIVRADHAEEQAFATAMGPYLLLAGWQEAYAATGRKKQAADKEESTGTTEYACRHGAVAVTIECGQHKDPEAPEVAYQAIRNALRYLQMTGEPTMEKGTQTKQLVTVTHVFYRDDDGKFIKSWKNLEELKKGEAIAQRADGSTLAAPSNGFIIMPKAEAPLGEEWFYFGVGAST